MVGASLQDGQEIQTGVVFVYERQGADWIQRERLSALSGETGDRFGNAVALSGETIVVGAYYEDSQSVGVDGNEEDNFANDSGAAYIWGRGSDGRWEQRAYLKASNPDGGGNNPFLGDHFGRAVAIDGDTVAVGAPGEDSGSSGVGGNQLDNTASNAGAVYVFVGKEGRPWEQQAYIKSPAAEPGDAFGNSVALSDNTLVVGAPGESSGVVGDPGDDSAQWSGAAYIYERGPEGWEYVQTIKAPNLDEGDQFGHRVAIDGETLVISAQNEGSAAGGVGEVRFDNGAPESGAVYVYVKDETEGRWLLDAYVKPHNPAGRDQFGYSVSLDGDSLLVGAPQADPASFSGSDFPGVAYRFVRDPVDGEWREEDFLNASNARRDANYGFSVAISGGFSLVGAPRERSTGPAHWRRLYLREGSILVGGDRIDRNRRERDHPTEHADRDRAQCRHRVFA